MKEFEEMTRDEIVFTHNKELLEMYDRAVESLGSSRFIQRIITKYYGKSLFEIFDYIKKEESLYVSDIFFPGEKIIMYPNIKEQKSRKVITCDFSGGLIFPGSVYVSFRPMLKNMDDGTAYVLKRTLKVESGYISSLPRNIQEFETLALNMQYDYFNHGGIDYNHLSQRVGGNFIFQKLKK